MSFAGGLSVGVVLSFQATDVGLVADVVMLLLVVVVVRFCLVVGRGGGGAVLFFSWDLWSFAVFRALTGAGIGGEYTAINSAIQELIPARFRGRPDLPIHGSFW